MIRMPSVDSAMRTIHAASVFQCPMHLDVVLCRFQRGDCGEPHRYLKMTVQGGCFIFTPLAVRPSDRRFAARALDRCVEQPSHALSTPVQHPCPDTMINFGVSADWFPMNQKISG